ncbi:uncharacterized protein UV8b_04754 [Ustilaginoidea virens]|uniref:Uncharacterized protein n=1 Tax=Ustilaginoidea virens TaxID=1159556 RepID=A0A8E5HSE6_USTVR|nr:uncharacterized protein UV8b_04754 [Ustilaginoidea virens]QUC20513.1 hypothetical protein UV8b_04754 [Ustilaginoidea virens]
MGPISQMPKGPNPRAELLQTHAKRPGRWWRRRLRPPSGLFGLLGCCLSDTGCCSGRLGHGECKEAGNEPYGVAQLQASLARGPDGRCEERAGCQGAPVAVVDVINGAWHGMAAQPPGRGGWALEAGNDDTLGQSNCVDAR